MLIDPVGNIWKWVYNELGQNTEAIDPFGNKVIYTFDVVGRVDSRTDRLGRVIEYVYLDNGWLQNEIWKTSGGSTVNTIRQIKWVRLNFR